MQCKNERSDTGAFADTQDGEQSEGSQKSDGGGNTMKSDQTTDVFNRGSSRNNRGGCVRQNGQTGSDASSKFRGGVEQQVVCAAVERDGSDNLIKRSSVLTTGKQKRTRGCIGESPQSKRSEKSAARRIQGEGKMERVARCADSPNPKCTRWMKKYRCLEQHESDRTRASLMT